MSADGDEDEKEENSNLKKELSQVMKSDAAEAGVAVSQSETDNNKVTEFKVSDEKKGVKYDVTVNRYVDEDEKNISITTKSKIDGKEQDVSEEEIVFERYDVSAGYSKEEIGKRYVDTTDKKGVLKTSEETRVDKKYQEASVARSSLGENDANLSEKITNVKKYFNRKEGVVAEKIHTEENKAGWTSVSDRSVKFKGDETKEDLSIYVYRDGRGHVETRLEAFNNNELFVANKSEKRGENYSSKKGDVTTSVTLNSSGELSGGVSDNEKIIKQLSQKELKKELKRMREKADRYAQELSDKDFNEYIQEFSSDLDPVVIKKFYTGNEKLAKRIKERRKEEYDERFKDRSNNTLPEQIALRKMAELKGR